MPSLAEALAKQQPRNGGLVCTVCELLTELKQEDKDALTHALANVKMPATIIARALDDYGKGISVGTLRRHRRQECATYRT